MFQYTDDTLGDSRPLGELLTEILEMPAEAISNIKCLHIGTVDDLKRVKTTDERVSKIEAEIAEFKSFFPQSRIVIIPSQEDIKKFGG